MAQLILTRDAKYDAIEISEWYEAQTLGAGERFLLALDKKFDAIRATPEIQRIISDTGIRRSKVESWPYLVFFVLSEDVAEVIAIIHTSRDPRYISERTGT